MSHMATTFDTTSQKRALSACHVASTCADMIDHTLKEIFIDTFTTRQEINFSQIGI